MKPTIERINTVELLNILGDEAPAGICIIQDGKFRYFNSNFPIATGYTADELIGEDSLEIVAPEDREMVRQNTINMLKRELLSPYQFRVIHKDGGVVWIMGAVKSIQYRGRRAILGNYMEVTQRKKVEEALRQSQERYRTMLEAMEDSYSEVDLGGHLTFVNNSLCRDLGYSREQVLGMSYKKFTSEDDIASVFQVYNEVYRTGLPNKGFSWKTTRKDGTHGFAETSVSPIRNDKSEIIGFRSVGRDISERKKAEEELSKTQAKLSSAVQMAHLGPWEYNAINDMFLFNDAFYEMFHTTAEKVGGYTMSSAEYANRFVHPEDAHLVAEEVRKALQANDPNFSSQVDHRIIYADGKVGYISVRFLIVKDETGKTVRTYGVNQDITERKQAEEALRQSKERYQSMLEEMEDAYSEVDLGGHFTFVNNSLCRDLGYSREELLGMSYKAFVAEDDIASVFQVYNEVYRTGIPNKGFSWKTIRKDGTNGIAESSVSPIRNHKGEIIGFRGVGRDVAERKKMEEKLRQSEENYRALFDSSVIGTIVLDAETVRVVMVNQAAAEIFGFNSLEEILGVDPLAFIHSEDRERVLELAKKGLGEQNSHQTHNLRGITKDGREIWISATGTRIMHEGRLAGLVCFTDITEQKRQNERLMMTDRLASIGELASGAAHELNNPLTSVIGFSQLLMEREVPDDIREDLKLINSEAQRAADVTKNLLTFARKHAPVKQLSQINNILEDVLRLRAYEHKINNIAVVKQLDPNLPEMMTDYFQMQQVFMNIIINAEYFMTAAHKKGTLSVTTKKQNGTVRISIADDGPDIPPQNLKRIFDPFFTTKEIGKGTGLGLSICHGIVTEHGWQIYDRSQPGKGATIHVELPINGVQTISNEAVKQANPD
jgi:two-component system NtrC family sensor kinase